MTGRLEVGILACEELFQVSGAGHVLMTCEVRTRLNLLNSVARSRHFDG
jgi:hypothetical protein